VERAHSHGKGSQVRQPTHPWNEPKRSHPPGSSLPATRFRPDGLQTPTYLLGARNSEGVSLHLLLMTARYHVKPLNQSLYSLQRCGGFGPNSNLCQPAFLFRFPPIRAFCVVSVPRFTARLVIRLGKKRHRMIGRASWELGFFNNFPRFVLSRSALARMCWQQLASLLSYPKVWTTGAKTVFFLFPLMVGRVTCPLLARGHDGSQ